jgi:hypothetical protein
MEYVSMSYHNMSLCHTIVIIYLCHNVMTISHISWIWSTVEYSLPIVSQYQAIVDSVVNQYYICMWVVGSAKWIHICISDGSMMMATIASPISVVLSVVLMYWIIMYIFKGLHLYYPSDLVSCLYTVQALYPERGRGRG